MMKYATAWLRWAFTLLKNVTSAVRKAHSPHSQTRALLGSLILLLIVTACQKQDDPATPQAPDSPITLSATIESRPNPNEYQVRLVWAGSATPSQWKITRRQNDRVTPLAVLPGDQRTYLDTSVTSGTTYSYKVASVGSDTFFESKDLGVSIFKDLEITDDVQFQTLSETQVLSVHRLFLKKGSYLTTNGADVRIEADEIHSEGGTIRSFRYAKTADNGQPGRSGGRIEILARTGTGLLYVTASGENGGRGSPGKPGKTGLTGARGQDGQCGYRGTDIKCENVERRDFDLWRHFAETGGQDQAYYRNLLAKFFCRTPTANGGPGLEGGRGENGGDGAQGGDSGNIFVRINLPEHIQIEPSLYPGDGGAGAPWGDGGEGGEGGPPGLPDHLGLCSPALPGPKGPRGPIGVYGKKGPKGKPLSFCLVLGDHLTGDCQL